MCVDRLKRRKTSNCRGMLGFIVVSIQRRHHNATCDMDWGRSIHVPAFLVFEKVLVSVFDNGIMYCMTTPSVSKFGSSVISVVSTKSCYGAGYDPSNTFQRHNSTTEFTPLISNSST